MWTNQHMTQVSDVYYRGETHEHMYGTDKPMTRDDMAPPMQLTDHSQRGILHCRPPQIGSKTKSNQIELYPGIS